MKQVILTSITEGCEGPMVVSGYIASLPAVSAAVELLGAEGGITRALYILFYVITTISTLGLEVSDLTESSHAVR